MDEINTKVVKQVVRLYMFAHEFALPVIRAFIVNNILDGTTYNDLSDFLQQHMHQIYHLMVKVKCCKCKPLPMISSSGCKITMLQLKKLYNVGQSDMTHFIRSKNAISQQCICGLTVNSSCALKELDISLIHALFKECALLKYDHTMWLDKINDQRNELCHISDLSKLTESDTQTMWGYLEGSVVGLAKDVPPYPEYMESIERQIKLLKIADYGLDDVRPIIDEMKTEWKAMQSELSNNMNGVIQHQSDKLIDNLKTFSNKCEEHRILDKREIHDQIHESASAISAKVEACHSEGKQNLQNQTRTIQFTLDKNQRKQENLLDAIHKEIIKGNMMSHKRDQVQFDIELTSKPMVMGNYDDNEKDYVELKISTPGALGEKKEKIKQYLEKAVEMINLAEPFEIKFVRDGCINIGTLLPVGILNNEQEFKRVICRFLDQMVTNCDIDTRIPLVVKVKITVFDNEQEGSVNCFIDEANQTTMKDKAIQAVPTMVDKIIEAKKIEISPTHYDPVSVNCPIDEAYQTTMKDKAVQTMVDKFIEAKKIEISPTYYDPGQMKTDTEIEKQFLYLIMFSYKIAKTVVWKFFEIGVLGRPQYNNDICIFLENHKHELFHLVGDYRCCQCTNLSPFQRSSLTFRLGRNQFKKLYQFGLSQPGHLMKGSGGRVIQHCLCCVTVRRETNPKTYDISLLITILYNCVQLHDNERLYLETIRKCRNRLCHITSDINDLSQNELKIMRENLEMSVLMLAERIPHHSDLKESIELLMDTLKYTDYTRETLTPIMEAIQLDMSNEIYCGTPLVDLISQKSMEDTKDVVKHMQESMKTIVQTKQGVYHQQSQSQIEEIEPHKEVKKDVIKSSQADIQQNHVFNLSMRIETQEDNIADIVKAIEKEIDTSKESSSIQIINICEG